MRRIVLMLLTMMSLLSCKTSKNIVYFQEVENGKSQKIAEEQYIRLKPQDQISILVNSKDPQLAALFNLTRAQIGAGTIRLTTSYNNEMSGYTLDPDGCIDFPVLGRIKIAGMTKGEVASYIKNKLITENLVNDAVVTVEFMNLYFSIMGEVKNPGKYLITKDKLTLLEALSMAGDLTIQGVRGGIYVIREEDGMRTTYTVDIRNNEFFNSPVYYLK